jgi:hypothetical protein
LRPIKSKELIPEVAKSTGLSESLITDITHFYWREIRKSLSSLKHNRIHVTNLGDFVTKHWKIDDKILALEKFEEKNRLKGMKEMIARFKTVENLVELRNLKKMVEEEKQREEFIKMHKKMANESKGEHNQDMENQGSDLGGSDQ